jgi:sulfite reductase alpha subunit-like flavoprotein
MCCGCQVQDTAEGDAEGCLLDVSIKVEGRYARMRSQALVKFAYPECTIEGDTLQIGIQKGFLSVPSDPKIPILCIGPGTGIAPMRALIQHRVSQGASSNTLYFGCRSASKDHHYSAEWRALEEDEPKMLTYRVAFSRDGPEGVKRTYVQDLMEEDGECVWDVLGRRGGWAYISGYVC